VSTDKITPADMAEFLSRNTANGEWWEEFIKDGGVVPEYHERQEVKISFQRIAGGQSLPAGREPAGMPTVSIDDKERRRK
jgi:hypothetical protein